MSTSDKRAQAADLIQAGIAAMKSGRKADARSLLEQALEADPRSEQGWLWLSGAVDSDEERRFCLAQVLSINEWNHAADAGLTKLGPGPARSPLALPTTPAKPAPPAAEAPVWSQWRDEAASAEATATPEPPAARAPAWSQWRDEPPTEAVTAPQPPVAKAPIWSQWRDEPAPAEAVTAPEPPAAEAPVWSQWRDEATAAEAVTAPEPPAAEAPVWSQWRDEAASTEAAATREPPAAKAPAWYRRRQQAPSTAPTRASMPRAWLVMVLILTACLLVGILLLFLVNSGILSK